jgi:hypothetical protein
MSAHDDHQMTGRSSPPLDRSLVGKFVLWSALWLIFVAGCGALSNVMAIRDDHIRATLAQHGSRAVGTLSTEDRLAGTPHWHGCGKGTHAVLRFVPHGQSPRRKCVSEGLPGEYRHYAYERGLEDARVLVIYDPAKASRFFVAAPDGSMLRRDLSGLWQRWLIQTTILFGLFLLVMAVILWRKRRPA